MDCVRLSHDRVTFDVDRDDCQSSSGDEVDCWRVAICSTLVLCYLCISILINTSSSVLTCYKQRHVNNRHHRLLKTSSIAVETLRSTSKVALSWDKRTKLISYLTPRWTINTYFVTQFGHWGQYERSTVCVWERERERERERGGGIKLIEIKGEVSEHSRLVSLISDNAIEIFVVSFGLF